MAADGTVRRVTEREWTATCSVRIARDRSTAAASAHLTTKGDEVKLAAIWHREDPKEWGNRYATRWNHRDADGGCWSVEYGYDGRFWCLFGPEGSPWGHLLTNTISSALAEATEYMARTVARARDLAG
ncbi:hypothetical protein [Verrucosispora sp. TAA-831]|uniref:hypothetical protein n=1 Tax=Verrucosispora sp. TAA-831 TaxID=3422227 RepID=UPI003D6F4A27